MISPSQPPVERTPFNVDGSDTSANQVGVPVQYVGGAQKYVMDPITPLYNLHSKTLSTGSKGAKGGAGSGRKVWYADVAYLICVVPSGQPLDEVSMLIINHAIAWRGNVV